MDFLEAALAIGVDEYTARAAQERISAGGITLLAVSGKLASGKDSVAQAAMTALGAGDAAHHYYADAMKNEVDQAIAIVDATPTGDDPASRIADEQDVPVELARKVATLLTAELTQNPAVHARVRTEGMREVLQLWGTEIRRAQDPDYWVKKTLRAAVAAIANGSSVYITDVRFPNEVSFAQQLGFIVARIEISTQTQAARLAGRDALAPSAEALSHASERALDDYQGFDLVVDNNGALGDTVATLVEAVISRRQP